jgi:4'-phosphopantetheinyl transferase
MWWVARGEDRLPRDLHWLTRAEATYVEGLRYTKRRTEFLLRRLTAKHAVAAVLGLAADPASLTRVEVRNHPTGAPFVLLDGRLCGLTVSISDRAGWAICLVTHDPIAIGCDLEIVEPRSPGFVDDFLTPVEQSYVAAQPAAEARAAAANLVWSAKESALKVLQTGLRRDTRTVEVTVHVGQTHGWTPMTVRTTEGAALPGWWRRAGSFLCTIVADLPVAPPVALDQPDPLANAVPRHSWLSRPLIGVPVGGDAGQDAARPRPSAGHRAPCPAPARRRGMGAGRAPG